MGNIFLIKGHHRKENSEYIIEKIQILHKNYQSNNYLFLGSSGGFLHEIREKVIEKTDSIFNNNFKVINQYVVEELKKYHSDMIHVDKSMLSALVLDVIEDNSSVDELLKSGTGIVELFMTFYSVVNEHSPEKLLAESQLVEDQLIKEFSGIYAKFQSLLMSKNMFSTYDAYNNLTKIIESGIYRNNAKKTTLFIDGFDDLSNLVRHFLAVFANCFEEVYITIPTDANYRLTDYTFDEFVDLCRSRQRDTKSTINEVLIPHKVTDDIRKMCDAFENTTFNKTEASNHPFKIAEAQNPHEQIMLTASIVKKMVVQEKTTLDNIAVVTRDINKTGKTLADTFDKFGIPYRFEGDVSILESINVNRLILPFKIFYSGFDPELILNYIESGYVDLDDITFAEFETVFHNAGLAYGKRQFNRNYYFSSFKSRKNEWLLRIKNYKEFLFERKESLNKTVDLQFNEFENLEKEYTLICRAEDIIRSTFKNLHEIFSSSKKIPLNYYEEYLKKQFTLLMEKDMISEDEFEQISVTGFFEDVLIEIKQLFIVMKKEEPIMVNPAEYWKYLNLILQNKTFHSSTFIENRCMIMDLEASRYRNKDIKIYINMLDGKYPQTNINKIYEHFSINGMTLQDSAILREERNFLLSMRNTNKQVILIYPTGDITGNPQIRSFYVDRLLSLENGQENQPKHYIKIQKFEKFQDYSIQDFIINKLNHYDFDSEIFYKICSEFNLDWKFIKQSVEQMKFNDRTAFFIENSETIKQLFGNSLSPSKYGVLRKCSREFYFKYLMKINFNDDETEGFDYAMEGQILHSVLHSLFSDLSKKKILLENMEEIDFRNFFSLKVVEYIQNEVKAKMFHPERILYEAEVDYFNKLIFDFLNRYRNSKVLLSNPEPAKYDQAVFYPENFEISINQKDNIKVFENPDIFLIGKIDRMDKAANGNLYIYDYKRSAGSAKKDNLFQLMLYAYAESLKGNRIIGMGFLPIKSNLKKVTGAFLSYDEEMDSYCVLNRGKPDVEQIYTFQDLECEITEKITKVFSGNLTPEEEPKCFNCDLKNTGLCFLRKSGESN